MNRVIDFPQWWWGPFGAAPSRRSFTEYVADGTIDPELGAWLWVLIEHGASTIVCAGPSGAGKSTLLTSLISFLLPRRNLHFVRGRYERFENIALPASTLLINEISSHLPIYLWGQGLVGAHQLAGQGAQLMATAHADSSGELINQLVSFPNDVPMTDLGCWDIVVFLRAWIAGKAIHREIRAIDSFHLNSGGELAIDELAIRDRRRSALRVDFDAFRRLAMRSRIDPSILDSEISQRAALLLNPGSMRHRSRS
jgi:energy-coupling factor transporter ATP-binding protein EcfA2